MKIGVIIIKILWMMVSIHYFYLYIAPILIGFIANFFYLDIDFILYNNFDLFYKQTIIFIGFSIILYELFSTKYGKIVFSIILMILIIIFIINNCR